MVVVVRRFSVGTGKMRRWVGSKPIGAMSAAEVVSMPLMLVACGGRLRIYRHSAHGIGVYRAEVFHWRTIYSVYLNVNPVGDSPIGK